MKKVDVVVIGAGIQGAGIAQAAAAAGYSVIVIEKNEVASGTSCKSSKLIHGGLRYLESFQFSLVRKALKERAILCRIAPKLVKLQPFYIPIYEKTSRRPWKIRLGLSLYALMGGLKKNNLFKQVKKSKLNNIDGLRESALQKIYCYYDGQTNDALLTKAVMNSAEQLGVKLLTNTDIGSIGKRGHNFILQYKNKQQTTEVEAKVIVNAAGPWVNEIRHICNFKFEKLDIDLVQGTHIVLDTPAPSGIYYLEADDNRAIFVMPYEYEGTKKTLLGTTEKLFVGKADDVIATDKEVDYLLTVYKSYFEFKGDLKVLHRFAGLRVLPMNHSSMFSSPRDTILYWASEGFLNVYGGKLTAYRATANSVVKKIKGQLPKRKRIAYTEQLYL